MRRSPVMRLALCFVVCLVSLARTACAVKPPAGAIVWWSFDPTRFEHPDQEPAYDAFLPVLRAGVGSGLFGDGTEASILEGLLAASEVGRAPHTFAVIDFEAERESDNTGMRVRKLQAVLELRTGEGHERFLRTIKRIALDAPKAKDAKGDLVAGQFKLDLPGGRTGVALRDSEDEQWEQLAWCSEDGVFTIGYGVGALERWFESTPAERAAWDDHRALIDDARPEGERALEAFIDIDALRERFPSAFEFGRTPRMLAALGFTEASSVMLHARFVEDRAGALPLLVLDHTLNEHGVLRRVPWTLDAWPHGLARLAPDSGATYALVATPDWARFVEYAIGVHNATIPDKKINQHMAEVETWRHAHADDLSRLLESLGNHLVLTDAPQPPAPVPGLATVLVPVAGERSTTAGAMSSVLSEFSGRVRTTSAGDRTTWTYSIDSSGFVRLPIWTIVERRGRVMLIGGWGRACVDAGLAWIEGEGDG